jgi:hypothetical protein
MSAVFSQSEIDEAYGQSRPQITTYPTIKFCSADSAKGKSEVKHFTLLGKDKDGKLTAEDLGEKLEVCFMTRGNFRLKKGSYTSSEAKEPQTSPIINVYKQDKATGKRSLERSGVWKEMKEKFGLSTQQLPYGTVGENIAKIIISPSSLENYWKYLEEFKGDERVYQFMTIVKSEDKITIGKDGEYYKMSFTRGDKLDQESIEMMVEDIMDLRDKLKKNEEAYQVKQEETRPKADMTMPDIEESIIDEEDPTAEELSNAGL